MGQRITDMIGQRFGKLLVLEEREPIIKVWGGKIHKRRQYFCKCDCGGDVVAEQSNIRTGNSTSCGCESSQKTIGQRSLTHGYAPRATGGERRRLYYVWGGMLARCNNPKNDNFQHYGGRGIVVCERWHKFENFIADMGIRPLGATLDRIDPNGHYEPSNCRWATWQQQHRNRGSHVPSIPVSLLMEVVGQEEAQRILALAEAVLVERRNRALVA